METIDGNPVAIALCVIMFFAIILMKIRQVNINREYREELKSHGLKQVCVGGRFGYSYITTDSKGGN